MCSQCGEAEPTDDDEDDEDEEEPELEDAERDGDGEAANKCEDMVVDDEHEEEVADTGPEGAGATKQASDPSADEGSVPMAVEPETHMGSALLHEPFEGEADERAAAGVGVGTDASADASADDELAGTDDEAAGAEQVEYKEPQHDPIPHDETSTPAYLPKDKDGPLHFCERVLIRDIEGEHQDYNLLRGLATRWHAPNDADKTGTYEISVDNNDFCIRVAPENLMRAHSYDYKTEAARKQFKARMFDPILRKSNGEPLKTDFRQITMPSTNHEVMPPQFAVLASLIPVATEEILQSGQAERKVVDPQEWAKGLNLKLPTDKKDFADITDVVTSVENKLIWRMLPNTIRSVMTALIESGKLDWDDILEDGNLFWDISYTERPEWPEPDRWHQTIVNFLLQMAWERSIDLHQPLYPTARMQVLRDLFLGEWSMRSHRVGMQMWKHYFPDKMPAAEEDDLPHDVLPREAQLQRTSPADLSLYEIQRNANILANQLKLRELFGDDHVAEGAARPKPKAKSRGASSSSTAAAAAAPSRSSARARPKVSYVEQKKPKARGRGASDDDDDDASDDDAAGSGDEFEEDSDDEGGSGADSSDEYADDEDEEGGGGGGKQRAMSKAEGKKPKAPKQKSKAAAGGGGGGKGKAAGAGAGGGKKKQEKSGKYGSVPFGGKGFRCPSKGACDEFFSSAEEVRRSRRARARTAQCAARFCTSPSLMHRLRFVVAADRAGTRSRQGQARPQRRARGRRGRHEPVPVGRLPPQAQGALGQGQDVLEQPVQARGAAREGHAAAPSLRLPAPRLRRGLRQGRRHGVEARLGGARHPARPQALPVGGLPEGRPGASLQVSVRLQGARVDAHGHLPVHLRVWIRQRRQEDPRAAPARIQVPEGPAAQGRQQRQLSRQRGGGGDGGRERQTDGRDGRAARALHSRLLCHV